MTDQTVIAEKSTDEALNWASPRTWITLFLAGTQLSLITGMVVLIPVNVAQRVFDGGLFIELVTVGIGAPLLWVIAFNGWIVGAVPEMGQQNNDYWFGNLSRKLLKKDRIIINVFSCYFVISTLALTWFLIYIFDLELTIAASVGAISLSGHLRSSKTISFVISQI